MNLGSTQVAFGFLIALVGFDFELTTMSSYFLIWLETVRDQPVPPLADVDKVFAILLVKVQGRDTTRIFDEHNDGKLTRRP